MATIVPNIGKYDLFTTGWTSKVTWAKLFTNLDVEVDEQSCTLEYVGGALSPTADIVFDVGASTDDVAYIMIGYTSGTDVAVYIKDLPSLYDFTTAGTLTIDTWTISIGGTHILTAGKEIMAEQGFTSIITWAKLYTSANELLDSENVTLSANGQGIMQPTADIVFNVATGKVANYITLGYTPSSDVVCYKRVLSSSYTFTTAGTLTVDSWTITI